MRKPSHHLLVLSARVSKIVSSARAVAISTKRRRPDRWVPFDRYPRAVVRRLLRGPGWPGGHMRVFLNLCAGLDRLGVPYRVNDYRPASQSRGSRVRDRQAAGAREDPVRDADRIRCAGYDHPIDNPTLFSDHNIRGVLVPAKWVRQREPHWGDKVHVWPVGIDTDGWQPSPNVTARCRCPGSRPRSGAIRTVIMRRCGIRSFATWRRGASALPPFAMASIASSSSATSWPASLDGVPVRARNPGDRPAAGLVL